MPSSIKRKAELGADFNVIFVEAQRATADEMEAFIYRSRWGASEGLWTKDQPCSTAGNGLPYMVLLGNEGQVLITGVPSESKLKDLIQAELKRAKGVPKDAQPALAKAYMEFNKGNYASAISAANNLAATPADEDKHGVAPKAAALAEAWTSQANARVERLKGMLAHGRFAKVDAQIVELKAAFKGLESLEQQLASVTEELAKPEQKTAREAAKALDSLLEKVNEKGVDERALKDLRKLAEKFSGTQSAARAAHLADVLEKKPSQD